MGRISAASARTRRAEAPVCSCGDWQDSRSSVAQMVDGIQDDDMDWVARRREDSGRRLQDKIQAVRAELGATEAAWNRNRMEGMELLVADEMEWRKSFLCCIVSRSSATTIWLLRCCRN